MKRVCGVIVAYNPEPNLIYNVNRLVNVVDYVLIVDNCSSSEESKSILNEILENNSNTEIIYNNENRGIATALNQGCKFAKEQGFEWVLTLDDDSLIEENMVQNMLKAYEKEANEKIAILTPSIVNYNELNHSKISKYVNVAITSGSLIKTRLFDEIGWFKDQYFIDMVDVEFCLRIKRYNYKTFMVFDAVLYHRLGREKSIFKIGKIEWKTLNHNEVRKYYIYRNTVQMYKEYFLILPIPLLFSTKGVLKIFLDTMFLEENKISKLKMIKNGIIDGLKNKMGKLNETEISR